VPTPDADTGPNNLQNFPEMTSAVLMGNTLQVAYAVPSESANSPYPLRIEFFKADAGGTQGQTFLGSDTYSSPQNGAAVSIILNPAISLVPGDKILATATD